MTKSPSPTTSRKWPQSELCGCTWKFSSVFDPRLRCEFDLLKKLPSCCSILALALQSRQRRPRRLGKNSGLLRWPKSVICPQGVIRADLRLAVRRSFFRQAEHAKAVENVRVKKFQE